MPDPSANPKTGPYFRHHTAIPRRRSRTKAALVVLGVGLACAGLVFSLLDAEPGFWRRHRERLSLSSEGDLRTRSDAAEARLLRAFEPVAPTETAGDGASASASAQNISALGDGKPLARAAVVAIPRLRRKSVAASETNGLADAAEPPASVDSALSGAAFDDEHPVRRLHVTCDELNAWIATRLKQWVKDQGYEVPEQIHDPIVATESGKLVVAFEYHAGSYSQVVSASFTATMMPSGDAMIQLQDAHLGKLPIPFLAMGKVLSHASPEDSTAAHAGKWLARLQGFEFTPVLPLEDGRRLRVLSYDIAEDGLELTATLEHTPAVAEVPGK